METSITGVVVVVEVGGVRGRRLRHAVPFSHDSTCRCSSPEFEDTLVPVAILFVCRPLVGLHGSVVGATSPAELELAQRACSKIVGQRSAFISKVFEKVRFDENARIELEWSHLHFILSQPS